MNKETSFDENFQVDLTNCDREPIHIPSLIQGHGVLIALDDELFIRQISANCAEHFGSAAEDFFGKSLEEVVGENYTDYLKTEILPQNLEAAPSYLNSLEINEKIFEAAIHRFQGILILEFEHPAFHR